MVDEDKTHGTEGTRNGTSLDKDEVLDYVSHNTNLRGGITEEYQILADGEPLYYGNIRRGNSASTRTLQTITFSWGGYVKKPTAAEIQEELDEIQENWNASFRNGNASPNRRPPTLDTPNARPQSGTHRQKLYLRKRSQTLVEIRFYQGSRRSRRRAHRTPTARQPPQLRY